MISNLEGVFAISLSLTSLVIFISVYILSGMRDWMLKFVIGDGKGYQWVIGNISHICSICFSRKSLEKYFEYIVWNTFFWDVIYLTNY